MDIEVTETGYRPYVRLFGDTDPMWVATVAFPEHGITMGLSHRASDPKGMWLADSRVESNGMVVFSHGKGDRTCRKQIAGPELVAAINEAFREAFRKETGYTGPLP